MNKKAQVDFIDTDVFYEPSYWILSAMAIFGLAIGFGLTGSVSGATGSEGINIPFYVKPILLIAVFPIAYIIVKIISR
jgi:hypothetical protein